jgi:hypothetical protein
MRRTLKWAAIGIPVALLVAQLIPIDRSNPPVQTLVPVSADLEGVLRRSCFDCHSNESVWPWYSRVAPVSWLLKHDVGEGREHVNYSEWNQYSAEQRAKMIHESWEEVESDEMPPWIYLLMHRDARLSDADKELIRGWAAAEGGEGG